jgi:type I site-specific restriction endonuclease
MNPYSIAGQRTITDGGIVPVGKSFIRRPSKCVGYLLRYRRDCPLAVVEAKPEYKTVPDGLQRRTGTPKSSDYGSLMREMARKQSSSTTSRARKQRAAHIRSQKISGSVSAKANR